MRWILIFLFFFIGCSEKKLIYIDTQVNSNKKSAKYIGIERIQMPLYMQDLQIMKNEKNSLKSTSVYLAQDPTTLLISFLSNELNDPYVFEYPFDINKKPDVLIKVNIVECLFRGDYLILQAKVFINDKFKKIDIKEKCNQNYDCIKKAFKKLSLSISKDIN